MKSLRNRNSHQEKLYQENNIHQPSTPTIILIHSNVNILSVLTWNNASFNTVVVPRSCHKWQQKYQLNVRGKSMIEFYKQKFINRKGGLSGVWLFLFGTLASFTCSRRKPRWARNTVLIKRGMVGSSIEERFLVLEGLDISYKALSILWAKIMITKGIYLAFYTEVSFLAVWSDGTYRAVYLCSNNIPLLQKNWAPFIYFSSNAPRHQLRLWRGIYRGCDLSALEPRNSTVL